MKKKLICLLMSAVMILLCFAGCAEATAEDVKWKIGAEASEGALTLSMHLMSEEPVSAAQEKLMEEKVNEYTESKYKIHLDLKYFTPDQYYTALEEDLAQQKEYYDSGSSHSESTEAPVYTDENGLPCIYYPPIKDFFVDVFYFSGYEKFYEYSALEYLANITDEVNGASKALKSVINSTLLTQFKEVNGGKFMAVPTNRAIGEYSYLLLNKEVLQKTHYSANDISSLVDKNCQDMLSLVNDYHGSDYVPLYSNTDEIDMLGVRYFNVDANGLQNNNFSLIAGTYNANWKTNTAYNFPVYNTFLDINDPSADNGHGKIASQLSTLKQYRSKGYYADETDAEKPFAVGFVKGGLEVLDQYGDEYEVVLVEKPMLYRNDLYEGMFGVSAKSSNIQGSCKIITLLNTDEGFRNLLLYGVEGENYTWKDSDVLDANGNPYRVVERETKEADKCYVMDVMKTGNVALAYPEMGDNPVKNSYIYEHNEALAVDTIIGFSIYGALKEGKLTPETLDALMQLSALSKEAYADLLATNTTEEYDAVKAAILSRLTSLPGYALLMSTSNSLRVYYNDWLRSVGLRDAIDTTV